MQKVEAKLNLFFALMACLCGLAFLGSPELGALPFIAIFFAIFGLVFVDLLRWFSLPSPMAYLGLGAIAFYAINRFITIGAVPGEPQMIVVAELLVFVQSVLMLQRKNRRVYEQLAVFALLELVVAAIFNNAVTYGIILVPLAVVAVGSLILLHLHSTAEHAFAGQELIESNLWVSSPKSEQSFVSTAARLPRVGLFTIGPAVFLVTLVFFYALPRTTQESRRGLGGKAQVGFNNEVHLGQIGKMLLNPAIAVRLEANQRRTGERYDLMGDFYLRGAVLEVYNATGALDGTWGTYENDPMLRPRQLPPSPRNSPAVGLIAADDVVVNITVSPMQSDALFSLPPYHYDSSGPEVVHRSDRWLIERRRRAKLSRDSQISYQFATHAFRGGTQGRFLPRFSVAETMELAEPDFGEEESPAPIQEGDTKETPESDRLTQEERDFADALRLDREQSAANYVAICLAYDEDVIPSAARFAESIIAEMDEEVAKNPVKVATAFEQELLRGNRLQYTLDLTMETILGLDPIEQFLSIDRRGNCQHFASALAMMLRSQGIPARLVVGFNTDEYNGIGGYFVARQLHAHAWVEALVDEKWLKPMDLLYQTGTPQQYWMRLDATPGGGGSTEVAAGGRVSNVLDMAQEMWTSYVVEADAVDRRGNRNVAIDDMSSSYQLYYEWLKLKVSRIRAGELGAGSLAGRDLFSWPSAAAAILFSIGAVAFYYWVLPRLSTTHAIHEAGLVAARPSIGYLDEAFQLLEKLGFRRGPSQTPHEFVNRAVAGLQRPDGPPLAAPMQGLTSVFYQERFGTGAKFTDSESSESRGQQVNMALQLLRDRVLEENRVIANQEAKA
jgi:transglutaminase-like putative cysteine protease